MCPFRSHISNKVPEIMQLFCRKMAILASKDTVDSNSLKSSFQRIFQNKKEKGNNKSATDCAKKSEKAQNGATSTTTQSKAKTSGVGPLIIDPVPDTPQKKMKQTVRNYMSYVNCSACRRYGPFLLSRRYKITTSRRPAPMAPRRAVRARGTPPVPWKFPRSCARTGHQSFPGRPPLAPISWPTLMRYIWQQHNVRLPSFFSS